jgi:NAD+ synthase (glutamine-hydrolysing)
LAVLNGSPFELGKTGQRRRCATAAAQLLDAPVLYANLVGGQDDLVFDGQSFIIDQNGQLLASAAGFQPDLLYCQIGEQDTSTPPLTATPTAGDTTTDTADAYQAAVLGLADYARKNGFRSAILGLSGGIDSALVATIASDALGPSNVVGVAMPSRYSSDHSLDDAADLAARLGLVYRVEPIEQLVASFDQQLALTGLAAENIQARVRGMILMAISNLEGHLVLATGNKSELATGYSTIYGDAVGGFAPIKDLVKTRVWQLAKYRNQRAAQRGETEPIPPRSISKPPSAELRPGQRDEDSLPAYQLLDLVLGQYVEQGCSRSDLLAAGHGAEAVDLVLRLTDRAEWKRRQYPPGPKITALAFGRDRRLPITNRWVEP